MDGELVPFCGYNMTTEDGEYALRNRNDWGGRSTVEDPQTSSDSDVDYQVDGTVTDGGCAPDECGDGCD
jgi:hypothetical protein